MIRTANAGDFAALIPDSEAAVRIWGLHKAYGESMPFVQFWCDTERLIFISLLDGAATLSVKENADISELTVFLNMQSDIRYVRTTQEAADSIANMGGWTTDGGAIMKPGPKLQSPLLLPESLTPRETYPVLAACFEQGLPTFDSWYVDISHRLRHGCCRIAGFKQDGVAITCAMTTAECDTAAIIGGVATLPEGRGRGYGSAGVLYLAHELMQEGKKVFLSPKNEMAHKLYSNIGFSQCGSWGNLKKIT